MEQHLADMMKVQKKKLALADSRAMELNDLRPSQDNQMMEPLAGAGAGGMAAGLARVIGSGKRKAKPKMEGGFLGALASLAIPLIGKLFGQGKMTDDAHKKLMALMKKRKVGETGRLQGGFLGALAGLAIPLISSLFGKGKMTKEAHDELCSCFNDMKSRSGSMSSDMSGGAKCMSGGAMYADPAFGVVNEVKPPTPAEAVGAGKYGSMLRSHLMKLKGEGFVKDFAHGFMGEAVPDPHAFRGDVGVQHSLPMKMRQAKIDKSVGKGLLGKDGKGQRKMAGGSVASDARKARGQAVSRLMKEKGMSLGEASRYVKENGF